MSSSRKASPARSQGMITPRRHSARRTASVGSARSSTSRLSAIQQFQDKNKDSFMLSPLNQKSILSDKSDIDQPGRKSWWKRLNENSKDVMEILQENVLQTNKAVEDMMDIEVLSQEKKDYTLDLPESSDGESISSIVIPQRKLFTQKENLPQNKFKQIKDTRETLAKLQKSTIVDKTLHVAPKSLFNKGTKKTRPEFPTELLSRSPNKTDINKTKEMSAAAPIVQVKSLFGNKGEKRKNMFADFIMAESEDEISEIQPKVFGFKKAEGKSRMSTRSHRETSPSSSFTTDIEMDDWKHLPSSTMVDNQLEYMITTPGKRTRISKLSEVKESEVVTANSNTTVNKSKASNKSSTSKNKSMLSPEKTLKDTEATKSNTTTTSTVENKSYTSKQRNISNRQTVEEQMEDLHTNETSVNKSKRNANKTNLDKTFSEEKATNKSNSSKLRNASKRQTVEEEMAELHDKDKSKTQTDITKSKINVTKTIQKDKSNTSKLIDTSQRQTEDKPSEKSMNKSKKNNETTKVSMEDNEQNNKSNTSKLRNISKRQIDEEPVADSIMDAEVKEKSINKSNRNASAVKNNLTKTLTEEDVHNQSNTSILRNASKRNMVEETEEENVMDEENNDKSINKSKRNTSIAKNNLTKTLNQEDGTHNLSNTSKLRNTPKRQTNEDKIVVLETNEISITKNKSSNGEVIGGNNKESLKQHSNIDDDIANMEDNENIVEASSEEDQDVDDENEEAEKVDSSAEQEKEKNDDVNENEELDEENSNISRVEDDSNPNQEDILEDKVEGHEEEEANNQVSVNKQSEHNMGDSKEESEVHSKVENSIDQEDKEESEEEEQEPEEEQYSEEEQEEEVMDVSEQEVDDEEQENESRELEENVSEEVEDDQEVDNEIQEDDNDPDEDNEIQKDDNDQEVETEIQEDDNNQEVVSEIREDDTDQEVDTEIQEDNADLEHEAEENEEGLKWVDEDNADQEDDNQDVEDEVQEEANSSQGQNESTENVSQEENDELEQQESDVEVDNHEGTPAIEQSEEEVGNTPNVTQDTTGRNLPIHTIRSPEDILDGKPNEAASFAVRGRNTSVRKTIIKDLNIRPSLAPARESTGISDGTVNSSAEGSGWDSHRTTRKTLRQTFGRDFTPRKSLRALVMEKTAKRQAEANDANDLKVPQANSTELPDDNQMTVGSITLPDGPSDDGMQGHEVEDDDTHDEDMQDHEMGDDDIHDEDMQDREMEYDDVHDEDTHDNEIEDDDDEDTLDNEMEDDEVHDEDTHDNEIEDDDVHDEDDEDTHDNDIEESVQESDHEVSKRTRQPTLELYLQKIKEQNMENKLKMEQAVRNSLKADRPKKDVFMFKVPARPPPKKSSIKRVPSKPKKQLKSIISLDELPPEVLVDMKYKPPKRFQPSNASWTTKRLYAFLEGKLEPKYDYKARIRAEELVQSIYKFTRDTARCTVAPPAAVAELRGEMARLRVVRTHFDFYDFFHKFMPREIRIKVVPDLVNKIPHPRHGIFSDIVVPD